MDISRNTFITVPQDVSNPLELHRFLSRLIEQLDVAFGERADNPFATTTGVTNIATKVSVLGTKAEANLNKETLYDLGDILISVDAVYNQTQVAQIAAELQDTKQAINNIHNRLKLARIIT